MQNSINNEILKQKSEFALLSSKKYLPRALDPKKEEYIKSSLVKVILGPRRAGKSTFAMYRASLMMLSALYFVRREINLTK